MKPAPVVARRMALLALGFLAAWWGSNRLADRSGLSILVDTPSTGRAALLLAYARHAGQEDVLVIGSSRVQSGILALEAEPLLQQLAGRPVGFYELGLAGIRPTILADVLETVTQARPPKELLVIAIENRMFCRPVGLAGEWNADDARGPADWPLRGLRAAWSARRYWDDELDREAARLEAQLGDRFVPADLERRLRKAGDKRIGQDDVFELAPDQVWRWSAAGEPDLVGWQRSLKVLEQLPCRVLFVKMPLQAGFEAQYMPAMGQRFVEDILGELNSREFEFVDLQGDPWPNTEDLFISKTHLNYRGAVETTRLFVERIVAPRLRAP